MCTKHTNTYHENDIETISGMLKQKFIVYVDTNIYMYTIKKKSKCADSNHQLVLIIVKKHPFYCLKSCKIYLTNIETLLLKLVKKNKRFSAVLLLLLT